MLKNDKTIMKSHGDVNTPIIGATVSAWAKLSEALKWLSPAEENESKNWKL